MAILEGDAAKEFVEQARERERVFAEESLRRKKIEAQHSGKEPFDYDKIASLVYVDKYMSGATLEERKANLEYDYYVTKSNMTTIQEFVKHIEIINQWAE
jgi:pyruvate/2-oxoglutarate dehydrogenase complex dihydrolipoamide dehydrogenase (E3) component